jgi:hypothetical protein
MISMRLEHPEDGYRCAGLCGALAVRLRGMVRLHTVVYLR